MRTIVVDDSKIMLRMFEQMSKDIPDINLEGSFERAEDAIRYAQNHPVDLAFLDVEMPGMNGIDFIKSFLPKKRVPFIVITSSPTRAFDAISAGAVEFMKKPLVHNSA